MAKKCEWEGKPAYEEGQLILQLDENGKWIVYHKPTTWRMMGKDIIFKQKREALAFVNALLESFDLNFDSKEKMEEVNGGKENCVRLRNEAYYKAMEPVVK